MSEQTDDERPMTPEEALEINGKWGPKLRAMLTRKQNHAIAELDQALAAVRDIDGELFRIATGGMDACGNENVTPDLMAYLLLAIAHSLRTDGPEE